MIDAERLSGAMKSFSDDGIVGNTVVVNDAVFRTLKGDDGRRKKFIVVEGYKVFGSKTVGKDEIFFPGYER